MEKEVRALFSREFFDAWHSNYAKLENYVKQQELTTLALDEELVQWMEIQKRIRHMLPEELNNKLAALNFNTEEITHSWHAMFRQLENFGQKHGHTYLPTDHAYEELKDWLIRQVMSKERLPENQFRLLDQLGVDWDMLISRENRWQQMYLRLKDFYTAFGHCRVPQGWKKDKQLALWVIVQRRKYAQGKLREEREQKLNKINFIWSIHEIYESQWEAYFQLLLSFYKKHGHCRVPCKHIKLVSWIERQRIARKRKLLQPEREKRLEKIGFIWSYDGAKVTVWEERYRQLQEFKRQSGHCFVPVNNKDCKALGTWVATQRTLEAHGRLHAERKQKLDLLGFVWGKDTHKQLKAMYDSRWESHFQRLKAYRQAYGTCQVSLKVAPELQRWTAWQRKLFYKGMLSQDRINKLNEINFPWSVQEGYWLDMYEALAQFRKEFGHTRVPFQWQPNPQLSAWVYRMKLNKAELSSQKIELLDQLGFDWSLNHKNMIPWESMYSRLVKFKQEYGHARVPVKWQEDPKLGKWVSRMRHERESLNPERVVLLERINFEWGNRTIQKTG